MKLILFVIAATSVLAAETHYAVEPQPVSILEDAAREAGYYEYEWSEGGASGSASGGASGSAAAGQAGAAGAGGEEHDYVFVPFLPMEMFADSVAAHENGHFASLTDFNMDGIADQFQMHGHTD